MIGRGSTGRLLWRGALRGRRLPSMSGPSWTAAAAGEVGVMDWGGLMFWFNDKSSLYNHTFGCLLPPRVEIVQANYY